MAFFDDGTEVADLSIPMTHIANHEVALSKNPAIYNPANRVPNESDDEDSVGFLAGAGYAVGSGLTNVAVSFANSGRALYNIPVSEENELEMLDTAEVLRGYGATNAANFYEAHRNSIDFTSEIAAAFIPGTLAVKALKVAQKSNAAIKLAKEAGGVPQFSDRIFGALDYFDTQGKTAAFAAKAAKADAQAPIFKGYNLMRAGYSLAEGFNESLVTTAAIAGALNQSSLFDDYSASNFARDVLFGTAISAPLKALALGAEVSKSRVLNGIKYNEENRVTGDFISDPWDERISRKLQDAENVQDPQVLQRVRTEIKEDFRNLLVGTDGEKAQMFGAFSKFLDETDGRTFDESMLGTKAIRAFSPVGLTKEDTVLLNTRNGEVKELEKIAPTAGDMQARVGKDWSISILNDAGKRDALNPASLRGMKKMFGAPASHIDAYALSVLKRLGTNPRSFSGNKERMGDFEYALQANDWTHLQAGYLKSLETGEDIPFFFGNKVRAVGPDELKKLAFERKAGLVQEALNRKMPLADIDVRFGVDTAKALETDFADGLFRYQTVNPKTVDRYFQPSHVVVERKSLPTGFDDRDEFLAQYDVRAAQAQRIQSYNASVGPLAREWMDVEQFGQLDATKATMETQTAKILLPGGGGSYAGPQNAAEVIGTIVSQGVDKLKRSVLDKFVGPAGNIARNPVRQAELSAALSYVRSMPARLQLQTLEDGTSVLFDTVAKLPLKNHTTGGAYVISKEVTPFLQEMQAQNKKLIDLHNADVAATGRGKKLNAETFYAPPPNLEAYPHAAFAKSPNGQIRAITAQTPEELQEKIRVISSDLPGVEINTLEEIKKNQRLYKEYKDSSLFDDPDFDFALNRKGSFAPAIPRADERVVEETLQWYADRSTAVLRKIARNSQSSVFDELEFMGDAVANTQARIGQRGQGPLRTGNPYHDLIKTALNYSKFDEYTALKSVNQTMEAIYSRSIGDFRLGVSNALSQGKYDAVKDEINRHFKATGQDFDYSKLSNLLLANSKTATTALSDDVNAANGVIANLSLGLDFLHPIVNAIGFSVVGWPELRSLAQRMGTKSEVDSALNLAIPGAGVSMPSPMKVMAGVIRDMFSGEKRAALKAKYAGVQTIDSTIFENQDSIEEVIQRLASGKPGAVKQFVTKNLDSIKQRTVVLPNAWMQIMAHEVADRMVRTAGLTDERLISSVRSQFSKRVNGNYTASQRGALLQGPLGHAMGLFQTWTLGVAQNFMRYAGNKETGNIAAFMTAQSAMFGVQSNPLFHALNSHLAARSQENEGLYQKYTDAGEVGDFLLYGAPSAAFNLSLYTRGDITPHNPTILPTSLDQIPVVSATLKTYNALASGFRKQAMDADANGLSAFGNVGDNILGAIALGSINRPLAGIATTALGYSMISAGGTGGQIIDPDVQDISAFARVLGSRPLGEQKTLDAYYRRLDVEAADQKKIKTLGAVITQRIAGGEEPTSDELANFTSSYIAAGGNPKGVRAFLTEAVNKSGPLADRIYKRAYEDPALEEWRALMSAYEAPGE